MPKLLTAPLSGAKAKPWLQGTNSVSMLAEGNKELLQDNLIKKRKNSITKERKKI